MSKEWKLLCFKKNEFDGFVKYTNNKLRIYGRIKPEYKNKISELNYIAADPAEDNYSFSGSGLPFHNFNQALEKKINVGNVKVINNEFNFKISVPNSYYTKLGTEYVNPRLYIKSCNSDHYEVINLGLCIPYRYLSHPSIDHYPSVTKKIFKPSSSLFYTNSLPQRSQEQILRDSAYPCKRDIPTNFWGLKPPL